MTHAFLSVQIKEVTNIGHIYNGLLCNYFCSKRKHVWLNSWCIVYWFSAHKLLNFSWKSSQFLLLLLTVHSALPSDVPREPFIWPTSLTTLDWPRVDVSWSNTQITWDINFVLEGILGNPASDVWSSKKRNYGAVGSYVFYYVAKASI